MIWSKSRNNRLQSLLIFPHQPGYIASNEAVLPFPFLGLPLIASCFPNNYNVLIVDERLSQARGKEKADIVFITTLTSTAPRAYKLASMYRRRGIPVVIGGVHATVRPEEVQRHATSVVIGEAENMVARLLADFEKDRLAPLYRSPCLADLDTIPNPAVHLLNWRHRFFLSPIQTNRGCPKSCDFCCVPSLSGRKLRMKSLSTVEKELHLLSRFRSRNLFVVDDNFTINKERSLEIMDLFVRFGFRWMGFSNLSVSEDDTYLNALRESGCISLFIGFESLNAQGHLAKNSAFGDSEAKARAINRIHKHGIGIQGSFIFGFDNETAEVFRETVSFIQDTGIELPHISILTPFPGTPLFDKLEKENRLIHKDWSRYDMNHTVFRPMNMSPEELQQGYAWSLKYLASPSSILARIKQKSTAKLYFLTANFSLYHAHTRIAKSLWNSKIQTLMQEKNLCPC